MSQTRVLIIDPQFKTEPDVEREVLPEGRYMVDVWWPKCGETVPAERLAWPDAIINCRSRHGLKAPTVAAIERARIVVQAGVGFNHIDLEACGRRSIPVCNTPDYGTMEVADHAIALMLSLQRGITAYHMRLLTRDDAWATLTLPLAAVRRQHGQVFGVLGLGRIGTAAALRAKAFGMRVVFFDPHLPPGTELALGIERVASLQALMAISDVLSVHCPLTAETTRLIDDAALAAAKPALLLVNTARGPIVDLDALADALRGGLIGGAALDVLPMEPADPDHPLINAWRDGEKWIEGRFVLTPHAAFYSPASLEDLHRKSVEVVIAYLRDGRLTNCVNRAFLKA